MNQSDTREMLDQGTIIAQPHLMGGGQKRVMPKKGKLDIVGKLSMITPCQADLEKRTFRFAEPGFNGKLLGYLNFDLYCCTCEAIPAK